MTYQTIIIFHSLKSMLNIIHIIQRYIFLQIRNDHDKIYTIQYNILFPTSTTFTMIMTIEYLVINNSHFSFDIFCTLNTFILFWAYPKCLSSVNSVTRNAWCIFLLLDHSTKTRLMKLSQLVFAYGIFFFKFTKCFCHEHGELKTHKSLGHTMSDSSLFSIQMTSRGPLFVFNFRICDSIQFQIIAEMSFVRLIDHGYDDDDDRENGCLLDLDLDWHLKKKKGYIKKDRDRLMMTILYVKQIMNEISS